MYEDNNEVITEQEKAEFGCPTPRNNTQLED